MIESNPQDDQYKIPLNLISDISILENQVAACRGGEHYQLTVDQFNFRDDGGIDFQRFCIKNNQREITGGI
ncbi:6676_t:CDS:2, partial [Funneliformis mosseae]